MGSSNNLTLKGLHDEWIGIKNQQAEMINLTLKSNCDVSNRVNYPMSERLKSKHSPFFREIHSVVIRTWFLKQFYKTQQFLCTSKP